MWAFYLAGAEMDFRYLHAMVFQLQLAAEIDAVPLTRDSMFRPDPESGQVALPRAMRR